MAPFAALTIDVFRLAVVAALVFVVLPRLLLAGSGGSRGVEDTVRMTGLVALVTLGLASVGLLDPVALMLSLFAAGAALRVIPGATRERALAGRRAALGTFYDLLENRRSLDLAEVLRRRAGVPLTLAASAGVALLAAKSAGSSAPGADFYLRELDEMEQSGLPAADDPAEGAVALLSALANLMDIDPAVLVSSGAALAFAAATTATVAISWRLTGRLLAAVMAGVAHILATRLAMPGSGTALDAFALNTAAAVALVAAVLVADLRHRQAGVLTSAVAIGLAAVVHPFAAAVAFNAGVSGLMLAVLAGSMAISMAFRIAAPAAALMLGVGAVGADGELADGLLGGPPPSPFDLTAVVGPDFVTVSAVAVVFAGVASVASSPQAERAPAVLAVCALAGGLMAVAAVPGNSPLLADEGVRILALPPVAVLLSLALVGFTRPARRPQAAAQLSVSASRSLS